MAAPTAGANAGLSGGVDANHVLNEVVDHRINVGDIVSYIFVGEKAVGVFGQMFGKFVVHLLKN